MMNALRRKTLVVGDRQMIATRTLGILFAAAIAVGSLPAVSEASFARQLGSRYGGTLSSNTSTSTQQLTADPVTVLKGSTSTTYDPHVVRLNNITPEEGFFIKEAYVGVSFDGGETEDLVSLGQFLEGLAFDFQETGYLQVFYQREEGGGEVLSTLASNDGYVVMDTDGEIFGDNTHTMLFDYIAENPLTVAHYRLYADNGSRGTSPDFLVSVDDPSFVIRDIEEANVAAALIPLPAALGPGLIGLAGVGLVKRLRRRIVA
jgi:hypothetical protein